MLQSSIKNNLPPLEREIALTQALIKITEILTELNLTADFQHLDKSNLSAVAKLYNEEGKLVSQGMGKGSGSRVGALFEAVEHWLTNSTCSKDVKNSIFRESHGCASDDRVGNERVMKVIQALPNKPLLCKRFKSMNDNNDIYYPLFLVSPSYGRCPHPDDKFPYEMVHRYTSNNGGAIGSSKVEALIHAINECVERERVSGFLAVQFYRDMRRTIWVVEKDGLDFETREIWSVVEQELSQEVILIDISEGDGFHAFFATTASSDLTQLPNFGSGCSLHSTLAAQRALTELLQTFNGLKIDLKSRNRTSVLKERFSTMAPLWRSLCFDVHKLMRNATVRLCSLAPTDSLTLRNLSSYLSQQLDILKSRGKSVYFDEIHVFKNGVSSVQCVVPGFDRFHTVLIGAPVLPSESVYSWQKNYSPINHG